MTDTIVNNSRTTTDTPEAVELSEKAKNMIASYSTRFPVVDLGEYKVVTHQDLSRTKVKKGCDANG